MAYSFDSASSGSAAAAVKKSFTADNGLKYQWDDAENDWVEFDGPDRSVNHKCLIVYYFVTCLL